MAADTTVTLTLEVRDDSSASADSLALTVAEADGSFITTWTTTGADLTITIPVGGHGGTYAAVWGDGGTSAGVTGDTDHGYAEAGTYTVSVSGDFARFHLDGDSDNAPKLASIEQWGDARWISMEGAFRGAANVEYKAADAPDLSGVTSMKTMFIRASSFNGDLSSWDVSRVTDMRGMFLIASAFNQDISSWDVSRVTDMRGMFLGASAFNRDISIWNVSGVEGMESMFGAPSSFDQNLGRWYVVPADASFDAADTSLNVTTISAQNAFLDGHNPAYGIGSGHNSTLFNMTGSTLMFKGAPDPGDYMVSVTASGGGVFSSGNNWRVLNVTVTGSANSPPVVDAGDDLTLIENSTFTLAGSATDPDGDALTHEWTQSPASPAIDFADAASPSTTFTAPPVDDDTAITLTLSVSDGTETVTDSLVLTVAEADGSFITAWEVTGSDRTISIPVGGAAGTYTVVWGDGNASTNVTGNQTHAYATAGAYAVSISGGFERFHLNGDPANAPGLLSIEQWGNARWTSMEDAFRGAANMEYNAVDAPNLSGVTSMENMFRGATAFSGDMSSWNVSSVESMAGMFFGASSFDRPLNGWNVSSVESMVDMFFGASSFDRPLNGWDVSSVNNMNSMFASAASFNQTLNGWDVSSVEIMAGMFSGASSFDGDISGWNVS